RKNSLCAKAGNKSEKRFYRVEKAYFLNFNPTLDLIKKPLYLKAAFSVYSSFAGNQLKNPLKFDGFD
ncbi:MAG: hypothetical protein ACR2LT_07845, partial [Pyrinomonadaceae bacterium]